MKCNHCQSEWTVSAAISASIKSCPFCGKAIASESGDKYSSMSATLKAIIANSGLEGLRDGKRALAMFSDLAPQLKREKRMFSYFIQCNGNFILLDALKQSRSEQVVCREKIVQQMIHVLLVNDDVAYEACDAFWDAIGGSSLIDDTSTKMISSEEFWQKLVAAVKHDIAPPAVDFFTTSSAAPLSVKLVGDCLELHCSNFFIAQSISKNEILDVVTRHASSILCRPIYVCVKAPQKSIDTCEATSSKMPTDAPNAVSPPPLPPKPNPARNPSTSGIKQSTPSIAPRPTVVLPEKKRTSSELYYEGLKFEKGYAAPRNLPLAIQLYTESAKQGFANAMFSLGELYAAGSGVEQNWNEAYLWYQRASEKGHIRAMLQLGLCYKDGLGTSKNAVEAFRWIRSAAARGDPKAQNMLSSLSDLVAAPGQKSSYDEQSTKADNPDEQYKLAQYYAAATRNYTLAAYYYEKAAQQGHSRAQLAIAEMYEKGRGVAVNLSKAKEYYRLAAKSDDAYVYQEATAASRLLQKLSPSPTTTKADSHTSWLKKLFWGS